MYLYVPWAKGYAIPIPTNFPRRYEWTTASEDEWKQRSDQITTNTGSNEQESDDRSTQEEQPDRQPDVDMNTQGEQQDESSSNPSDPPGYVDCAIASMTTIALITMGIGMAGRPKSTAPRFLPPAMLFFPIASGSRGNEPYANQTDYESTCTRNGQQLDDHGTLLSTFFIISVGIATVSIAHVLLPLAMHSIKLLYALYTKGARNTMQFIANAYTTTKVRRDGKYLNSKKTYKLLHRRQPVMSKIQTRRVDPINSYNFGSEAFRTFEEKIMPKAFNPSKFASPRSHKPSAPWWIGPFETSAKASDYAHGKPSTSINHPGITHTNNINRDAPESIPAPQPSPASQPTFQKGRGRGTRGGRSSRGHGQRSSPRH